MINAANAWLRRIGKRIRGAATPPAPDPRNATPVPAPVWKRLCHRHPFLAVLSETEAQRLIVLAGQFIATKQFSAAGGHELSEEIVASIAVQACLPILELGLDVYPTFTEIIVYPGEFLVERDIIDDAGVVHNMREPLSGEAWEGGPVVLSWQDARGHRRDLSGTNVVIHEFAHKLDMGNGAVDGLPRFYRSLHPDLNEPRWNAVFDAAFEDFIVRVEELEAGFPTDLDPESHEAEAHYATLPLDPYASTDPGEFFSVCAESFFTAPKRLAGAYPEVYAQLRLYFRQDPLARAAA